MSGSGAELRGDVRAKIAGWRVAATRITAAVLLVRGALFAVTLAALAVAYPTGVLVRPVVAAALAVLAFLPPLAPRTRIVTMVICVAVLGWLASTTAYFEPVTLPRLVTLSGLLYLVHTTAALAAVLPYDTVVSPAVLARWLARTVVVLVVSSAFAVGAMIGVTAVGGRALLLASVSGLLLVAALAGLLAAQRGRRTG